MEKTENRLAWHKNIYTGTYYSTHIGKNEPSLFSIIPMNASYYLIFQVPLERLGKKATSPTGRELYFSLDVAKARAEELLGEWFPPENWTYEEL